jgi:hypothetical protein
MKIAGWRSVTEWQRKKILDVTDRYKPLEKNRLKRLELITPFHICSNHI